MRTFWAFPDSPPHRPRIVRSTTNGYVSHRNRVRVNRYSGGGLSAKTWRTVRRSKTASVRTLHTSCTAENFTGGLSTLGCRPSAFHSKTSTRTSLVLCFQSHITCGLSVARYRTVRRHARPRGFKPRLTSPKPRLTSPKPRRSSLE
jgi:hypothetical protein